MKTKNSMSKELILTQTVRNLFNTIDTDDVLKIVGNSITCCGKPLNEGEYKLLTAEATNFLNSRIWKVLSKDVAYRAKEAMFEKAKTEEDLTAGKMCLYVLDIIKTRLEQISKLK